jgi:hypothetical protein
MRRFATLFTTTLFAAALSPMAHASTESCSSTLLEAPIEELQLLLQINQVQTTRIQAIRHDMGRQHEELEARVDPYYLPNRLEAVSLSALSQVKSVLAPWQLARCNSHVYHRPPPRLAYVPPPPRRVVHAPRQIVRPAPRRIVRPAPRRIMRPAPRRIVRPAPRRIVRPAPRRIVRPAPVVHRAPEAKAHRAPPRVVKRGKGHDKALKHRRAHR